MAGATAAKPAASEASNGRVATRRRGAADSGPGTGLGCGPRAGRGSGSGASNIVVIARSKGSIVQVSMAACSIDPTRVPRASRQVAGADQADGAALVGEPRDRRLGLPRAEGFELVVPFAHQHHAPRHPRMVAPEARPLVGQGVMQGQYAGAGGLAQPGTERTDGQRIEGHHWRQRPGSTDAWGRATLPPSLSITHLQARGSRSSPPHRKLRPPRYKILH